MRVKGPFEYITGFYKENIFKIRWSTLSFRIWFFLCDKPGNNSGPRNSAMRSEGCLSQLFQFDQTLLLLAGFVIHLMKRLGRSICLKIKPEKQQIIQTECRSFTIADILFTVHQTFRMGWQVLNVYLNFARTPYTLRTFKSS